ncbi:hypothetical protein [Tenacibaculum ovolyticum]|uniref:hypothetical protein n=1 Tax=Tenacibaculum ovolyticum TaxID=104270 RepID=UPI0003F95759|nr:hypothetical protein [Tenacibaculum ovolyticum]
MKLYCKKCNDLLTPETLKKSTFKEVRFIDEKELLFDGKYIDASEVDYNFEIPIDYLINTKSIVLKNHKESVRFQGCCGPSEFGALNQVCLKCNFEIGVLVADCWTSRFIGIDKSKVSEKPLWK